ncbi:MAG: hypothetical protein HKN25_10520 [Pyrinomonadaceae bacterium]|nr:hypothetical protein [Pyrinomonadaceae bacterium]
MKKYYLVLLIVLLILSSSVFPQAKPNPVSALTDEQKKTMISQVREQIGNLRTEENRLVFSAIAANMLWQQDQVLGEKLFSKLVARYEKLEAVYAEKRETKKFKGSLKSSTRGDVESFFRTFDSIKGIRRVLVSEMLTCDVARSYDFFVNTKSDSNIYFPVYDDTRLERKIIEALSDAPAEVAVRIGRKMLGVKFRGELVETLGSIRKKDSVLAAKFENEIVDKILSKSRNGDFDFYDFRRLFGYSFFSDMVSDKERSPFSDSALKRIADELARRILAGDKEFSNYGQNDYLRYIKKYSPGNFEKVKDKLKEKRKKKKADCDCDANGEIDSAIKSAMDKVKAAALAAVKDTANQLTDEEKARRLEAESLKRFKENLKLFGWRRIPEDKVSEFIEEADKRIDPNIITIANINNLARYVIGLSRYGRKAKGKGLLDQAARNITREPKSFLEYAKVWALIAGYSAAEPEKSFQMFEESIARLNATVQAASSLVEFIDVSKSFVIDNELQASHAYDFIDFMQKDAPLENFDLAIAILADSDFKRTRSLTDKIEKQEVRLFAQILIMKSLFSE